MDLRDSDDEDIQEKNQELSSSDVDSEEERRRSLFLLFLVGLKHTFYYSGYHLKLEFLFLFRYDEQIEDYLDQAYDHFVIKKDGSTKQRKRAKQMYSEDNQMLEVGTS